MHKGFFTAQEEQAIEHYLITGLPTDKILAIKKQANKNLSTIIHHTELIEKLIGLKRNI